MVEDLILSNPDHRCMTPLGAAGSIGTVYSRELMAPCAR
jgi:hypothetical protein